MLAEAAEKVCPMCSGSQSRRLLLSKNGFPILRCSTCGLAFTDDRTSPAPSQLYPHFDQSGTAALRKLRSAVSFFLKARVGFVRSLKRTGRLLDFGCGNGAFAKTMSEEGFDAVGLEPFSLGHTQQFERLALIQAPLEHVEDSLGTFDIITLWHVLEHLPRPVTVLSRLGRLLAPGGVLVVSVPNFQSWQSQWFGDAWFHLDPPRHLVHFEPATLADCLGRGGFIPIASHRFLPEYGSSGWIQSALNQALPHSNYLYELVKDRGALASMSRASFAFHLAASLVAGVPLLALSLPIEAAACAGDRGAAITMAARHR